MVDPPKKRQQPFSFTVEQKLWLIELSEREKLSNEELGLRLAEHVNKDRPAELVRVNPPGKSTIKDWKRDRAKLRAQLEQKGVESKRHRKEQYPELEEALFIWLQQMDNMGIYVNTEMLLEKAKEFGAALNIPDTFGYSPAWTSKFKARRGLKTSQTHGEAASAPQHLVDQAKRALPIVLKDYSADNVYNQDETGLFWRQGPTRRLSTGKHAGRKKDKTRVTVSVTCNASGSHKCGLFLIGKAKRPRSFPKRFNPETAMNMRYRSNASAWMTAKCFSDWVTDWNTKLAGCVCHE